MWVSGSANQAADCISRQLAGVRKVDGIGRLRPAVFSFFVKPRRPGGYSCTSCLTLFCLKKNLVLVFALLIPAESVVIPATT